VATTGICLNAHSQPPEEFEFYRDDGIMSSGWVRFTGGDYRAVQFDDVKNDGRPGVVTLYGACTYTG